MIDINGQRVQLNDRVKLLGVHIDDKLRFRNHISVISLRLSRQMITMNKVLKNLSKDCKVRLYTVFILSNFFTVP